MAELTKNPAGSPAPARPPARTKSEREGAPRDQFQEASAKVVDLVVAWRIPLLLGVVGVFAAAGGVTFWQNRQASRNEEGAAEIARIAAELPDDSALARLGINLDDVGRSAEEKSERAGKYVAAATKLEKVAQEYSNLTAGRVAQLERASLLVRAEKYDDAAAAYRAALNGGDAEPVFRFRALAGLGNVLRTQKNYAESAKQYEQASKELDGLWRQLAMDELGRTQELQGDYANAAKTYEALLKEFPNATNLSDIEARLATAKAGGPPPVPAAPPPAPETAPVDGSAPAAPAPDGAAPAAGAPAVAPEVAPQPESGGTTGSKTEEGGQ